MDLSTRLVFLDLFPNDYSRRELTHISPLQTYDTYVTQYQRTCTYIYIYYTSMNVPLLFSNGTYMYIGI